MPDSDSKGPSKSSPDPVKYASSLEGDRVDPRRCIMCAGDLLAPPWRREGTRRVIGLTYSATAEARHTRGTTRAQSPM